MNIFVKAGELKLINGGYVSVGESPVNNDRFIAAQRRAEFIVKFAEACKGKTFTASKVDSLEEVKAEVLRGLREDRKSVYFDQPKEVDQELTNRLKDEALAFVKRGKDVTKVDKLNNFMQEFNILQEFEEYGLFFENGIVKLNNVYTIKEIKSSLNEVIDLL